MSEDVPYNVHDDDFGFCDFIYVEFNGNANTFDGLNILYCSFFSDDLLFCKLQSIINRARNRE